uniref:BTB domain-containing protein n=1 Tax=Anopheles christyi TaxID=43041 RepID=A0A182K649_9DIPT
MSRRVIKTKNRWTATQLELLVNVWEKYYQSLKAARGNEEIYGLMVQELLEVGCVDATVKDIRGRIHNLSGKFRKEANLVSATGKPSQWGLYSKIEKFFEYEAPIQFKHVGPPPEYDMCEYLDMDLEMTETMAMQQYSREQANRDRAMENYAIDENSLDIEEFEIFDGVNPGEELVEEIGHPEQEQQSKEVVEKKDDASPVKEATAKPGCESSQPGDARTMAPDPDPKQDQPEVNEQSETNDESESENGTASLSDSSFDFEIPVSAASKTPQQSQLFHFNGSYRHAAMENFLSQLYSNQLYADVMLITCHEGVTCVMPAHRMVLANFSEFFSSILGALKPNTNGSPLTVLLQPDISQPVMQLLLQFMYTGKVSVTQELVGDFLRCGHVLRIRGVWSEEKESARDAKSPLRTVRPSKRRPSQASDSEESMGDQYDRSSVSTEERFAALNASDTKSSSSSLKESSDCTLTPHGRPKKRSRKKPMKRIKRMRYISDDEMDDVEVSSKIGMDLLRSDSETVESERAVGRDKHAHEKDAQEDTEETGDGISVDDHCGYADVDEEEDEDNDTDDESEDDSEDEEDDDDEFYDDRSFFMDTGEDDIETDFEANSIVNGNSASNPSTVTTTPEPTATKETISQKVNNNHRIQRCINISDVNVGNRSKPCNVEKDISIPAKVEKAQLEQDLAAPDGTIRKVQLSIHTPDVRRALQTIPTCTSVQQVSQKQPPPRRASVPPGHSFQSQPQQSNAKESTSRKQFLSKVRPWYGCRICGKRFQLSDNWLEHVVYKHASDEQLMNGENNPKEHITMLRCDLCSKYLGTKYDWVHHIVRKHTERYPHFHEELAMSDEIND